MPEIARFFGIIIRMYFEVDQKHHSPHIHAYYQDSMAIYNIETIERIAGSLPRRQQRFVEAWAELHQQELIENWDRLQKGHAPLKIDPLQ